MCTPEAILCWIPDTLVFWNDTRGRNNNITILSESSKGGDYSRGDIIRAIILKNTKKGENYSKVSYYLWKYVPYMKLSVWRQAGSESRLDFVLWFIWKKNQPGSRDEIICDHSGGN